MASPKSPRSSQAGPSSANPSSPRSAQAGPSSARQPSEPRSPEPAAPTAQVEPAPAAEIPFEENDEDDSGVDDWDDAASSTASLSESIFDYRNIHGRTFQNSKTTEYWGPNDDRQNNGLDISHHFVTMLLGDQLFEAPIKKPPTKVLDVGTGTGIWAIDMSDAYPSAEIIGTDISPIQPTWVPPNCIFHLEDAQLEWTYPPESFDFIHIRALYGSISDWGELYRQAYKVLMPGGWIEDFEFNITLMSDVPEVRDDPKHIFKRWSEVFTEAGERMGRTLLIGTGGRMRKLMQEAGFVDVVEKNYKVPSGRWSSDPTMKQIGAYNLAFLDESLEGFALFMLKEIMGWEYIEVQLFVAEMRKAINNPKIRPYYILTNVFARKPDVWEH
ncbi:S-adenosyl-L-methionine-dependent methyltransferase [Trichoderma reesei RUT C-30]|uniref:S-adenosyl-L-methionine-dependent methyltransferase n=2 Tax=Hypocrea jecorina TaxID=51453 RepID=A0A024S0D4_HYPJR|nr:S-adenosyl-L-methionine-dependent methyltransferase [Trichoderma reesei RUT C-30]